MPPPPVMLSLMGSPRGPFWVPSYSWGNSHTDKAEPFYCYADDTQLCVPLRPGASVVLRIMSCLYLSSNFLQLNEHEHYSLGALSKNVCIEACNLGVYRFILDVSGINPYHVFTVWTCVLHVTHIPIDFCYVCWSYNLWITHRVKVFICLITCEQE